MDLDERLALLATLPTPRSLDGLADDVFRRIATDAQERRSARIGLVTAAILAVAMGTGSTLVPTLPAAAHAPSPLMPSALAPSSLLAGE